MDYIIGIDEVGRGALAGPVVVVAAMMPKNVGAKLKLGALKDSKKLNARQRESWCAYFSKRPEISFAASRVYPRQIEKRNISGAANLAALRAYRRLMAITAAYRSERSSGGSKKSKSQSYGTVKIFLDGGLYLGSKKWQQKHILMAKTTPKADETVPAVAIASIIAKVHRDRFMAKMAKKYPRYGFEIHKGYGTKAHAAAIKKNGPCEIHRKSFLGKV